MSTLFPPEYQLATLLHKFLHSLCYSHSTLIRFSVLLNLKGFSCFHCHLNYESFTVYVLLLHTHRFGRQSYRPCLSGREKTFYSALCYVAQCLVHTWIDLTGVSGISEDLFIASKCGQVLILKSLSYFALRVYTGTY
jgi:hypothetical protein